MGERLELPCSFMYEHTDIPEGMTVDEYRIQRAARQRRRKRSRRPLWRVLKGLVARRPSYAPSREGIGSSGPRLGPSRFGPAG
jgi:hypothetical protein